MPELPEVETIVRKLNTVLVGQKISQVSVYNEKTFVGLPYLLDGAGVTRVSRRAKVIEIYLDNGLILLTHLKMTGQYLFKAKNQLVAGGHPTADWQEQLPGKHTRVEIDFVGGAKLFFNDMRKFGWLKLVSLSERDGVYAKFGPDIVDPTLTAGYLLEKFSRRKMSIKQAIMLNEIICGVGNIYACDSLNQAQISPLRPAASLTKTEVEKLLKSMQVIIKKAIEYGGTTFDGKYVNIDGKVGSYQTKILTYGREGKNCYNCGSTIAKIKLGGRGTYFCPTCQV